MQKIILILSTMAFLSACSVQTGLLVELEGNDEDFIGSATATLISGTFEVKNMSGMTCNGTYDQLTTSPMLSVSVKCSDGRYGNVMLLRTGPSLTSGSGEGKLNDGKRFRVYMGDMIHYRDTKGMWQK